MDENSRKGETSESVENNAVGETPSKTENVSNFFPNQTVGIVIDRGSGTSKNIVSDRCASSVDASGPSCTPSQSIYKNKNDKIKEVKRKETEEEEEEEEEDSEVEVEVEGEEIKGVDDDDEDSEAKLPVLYNTNQASRETETYVQVATEAQEQPEGGGTSIGPPPSYSFVMKQKKKGPKSEAPSDPLIVDWPPPPMYGGVRGVYGSPEEGRLCNFRDLSSLAEPIWRSHSQPALCPRCGILILTTTHSHDSIATHVTALALCLFGCWPCCLLPYCLNVCKNTYHHCPICQAFLGAYSPW